eukprot:4828485-Amphidinium_carterae.1
MPSQPARTHTRLLRHVQPAISDHQHSPHTLRGCLRLRGDTTIQCTPYLACRTAPEPFAKECSPRLPCEA